MNDVALCKKRGWTVGTILEGAETCKDYSHTDRILITALGEESILARHLPHNPKAHWESGREHSWTLEYRDWHAVDAPWPMPERRSE